jgi:FAD/FMN-containing dehydrogenase
MNLQPQNKATLQEAVLEAGRQGKPITSVDLSAMTEIRAYHPEDLTITVEAGMPLSDLAAELARHGQWLPLDPPPTEPWTIGRLIDANPSGPRRHRWGVLRDYVIGMEVIRASGECIHTGGQVVKNVAGFDLAKVFIGAGGRLGIVTAVSFKLLPLPLLEQTYIRHLEHHEELKELVEAMRQRGDHHHACLWDATARTDGTSGLDLWIGFSGHPSVVEKRAKALGDLGGRWQISSAWQRGTCALPVLEHERHFWNRRSWESTRMESVLPTRIHHLITARHPSDDPFVARLGQGICYHGSGTAGLPNRRQGRLEDRLRSLFDPNGVFSKFGEESLET